MAGSPALRKIDNPPNPYHRYAVEWLGEPPQVALDVFEERARSILASNDSPDIPFRWSINPYRGCFHGCAYCYARPSHQYLDFGAGTDFERKIVVKKNAPELLKAAFDKPSWKGERIVFSGDTDCYQPLEASYELTRKLLELCLEYRNPVGLITKGALISRDADLLSDLSRVTDVSVTLSIPFADDKKARAIEPYAPAPSARLRAMRTLADAGVRVGVGIAPVIPGLTDHDIPAIVTAAKEHGASSAFFSLLRLPGPVEQIFTQRLEEEFPERAAKVLSALRKMRGGKVNSSTFGERMSGRGAEWDAVVWLFRTACEKAGLADEETDVLPEEERASTFRRPTRQLSLF